MEVPVGGHEKSPPFAEVSTLRGLLAGDGCGASRHPHRPGASPIKSAREHMDMHAAYREVGHHDQSGRDSRDRHLGMERSTPILRHSLP
jgi:hypothetical protein